MVITMNAPIEYLANFVPNPNDYFEDFKNNLDWVRHDNVPRSEYYINDFSVPYTYGSGRGVRTYYPQKTSPTFEMLRYMLEAFTKTTFDVCFMNRYYNQKDHLGWHADDSPEMDDDCPIAIISFGVEREIWFRPQNDKNSIEKLLLGHGSLCIMKAGMQNTHYHRIPKAGFECGERISLTFRGYKKMNGDQNE